MMKSNEETRFKQVFKKDDNDYEYEISIQECGEVLIY